MDISDEQIAKSLKDMEVLDFGGSVPGELEQPLIYLDSLTTIEETLVDLLQRYKAGGEPDVRHQIDLVHDRMANGVQLFCESFMSQNDVLRLSTLRDSTLATVLVSIEEVRVQKIKGIVSGNDGAQFKQRFSSGVEALEFVLGVIDACGGYEDLDAYEFGHMVGIEYATWSGQQLEWLLQYLERGHNRTAVTGKHGKIGAATRLARSVLRTWLPTTRPQ